MPRALTPTMRVPYVMACDRDLAANHPARTTFWCRALSRREEIELRSLGEQYPDDVDPDGNVLKSNADQRIAAKIDYLLARGLVDWERFLDTDDRPVAFKRDTDATDGEQPYLDHMDSETQIEVSNFIHRGCRLTRDDVGKSDGPSCSDSAGSSAPALPAEQSGPTLQPVSAQ